MEQTYAQALYEAIAKGIEPAKAIHALAARLKREGRSALIPRVARAFERVAQREGARSRTVLYVAREKDAAKAQQAAAEYAKTQKHDVRVDETLIGGWRLEHEDRLVDVSYKSYLLELFERVIA